jgi:carboxypeptidase Q
MKQLFILAAFIPMLASAQSNADSVYIKKISDEIMRNGKAHDLLRELTKGIGGRLAGSVQYTKAVQWGEASLKKLRCRQSVFARMHDAQLEKRG